MAKKLLIEKAMNLLRADPERSHSDVAREVGIAQGSISRAVRLSGDKTLQSKAASRLAGGRNKVTKKMRKAYTKKVGKKSSYKKSPVFAEISSIVPGTKTLLIITDDQETINSIIGSFR